MKTAKFLSSLAIGLLLAACSGGGSNTTLTGGGGGGGGGVGGPTPSAIVVTSDSAAILADGSTSAKITAVAYDTNHVALANVAVTLSADTGVLAPYPAKTDSTGTVVTTLSTGGNPSPRTITITAAATGVTASTVPVQVIAKGSSSPVAKLTVTVDTPTILSDGSTTANVTAFALDASNNLLPNVPVLFTADNPAITSTSPTTDASGAAKAVVSTGGIPTLRTITVTACTGTCPGPVSATVKVQVVSGTGSVTVQMGSPAGAAFAPNVIAASSTTLSAGGSASLQVVLQQSDGTLYTQSAIINFSSICAAQNFATLTPSVTTTTGIATATYVASGCSPTDTVTATATVGGRALSASVTLNVAAAAIGSIRFVSATPQIIALKGLGSTALPESSTVIFKVLDQSGNPRPGAVVNFNLNTAVGGVGLLNANAQGIATATADANGNVSATVQSGTVATPVRVTAVVQGVSPAISTQSSALTISTGIPAQNGFSLAVACHNVEAWQLDGVQVQVTARLSDRFSNPVPDGTAVSFFAEGGQIAGNCTTTTVAGNSQCAVNWTSQNPRAPRDPNLPKCASLPVTAGTCDRDGRSSLLAIAIGEESFTDVNSNGAFDPGEPFVDQGERFLDANENGQYDNYGALPGSEFFYDFNNNGLRDGPDGKFNGVLCNDPARCDPNAKTTGIGAQNLIIMSDGVPNNLSPAAGTTFHVALGATKSLVFTFADLNNNPLPSGTTIAATIAGTGLSLGDPSSYTYPCTTEPLSYAFTVIDTASAGNTSGLLTLTVKSPGGGGGGGITSVFQYPIIVP